MLKHIGQNLLILLSALLTLAFGVLTAIELIPANPFGVTVKEPLNVSSSPLTADASLFVSVLTGKLVNPTDVSVIMDEVQVTVSDGKTEKTVSAGSYTLPPRTSCEIRLDWQDTAAFDHVRQIKVTVNGVADILPNAVSGIGINGTAILCAGLFVLSAFFLLYFAKIRYYMYQEDSVAVRGKQEKRSGTS